MRMRRGRARASAPAGVRRAVLALAGLAVWGTPAAGQDQESPFRFLRPSVDDHTTQSGPLQLELPEQSRLEPAAEPPSAVPDPPPSVASVPPPPALAPLAPRPLRLGLLAGREVRATMAALQPMSTQLAEALGRPVEFLPMSTYGTMIEAQAMQRIDGGFYSAVAFAAAEARCKCLEPIAAPAAADGTVAYYAIIVARRNSGIASAADLDGKTIAVGPEDSVAARRMQLAGLLEEGIDSASFDAMPAVPSGEGAVRLVAAGLADAAFAWSSLSGDIDRGYSRGTLTDLVARGEISMWDYAVIWRSAAIAHGPFAVAKSLPADERDRIEAYLLALEHSLPEVYDVLNPYYGGGYVAVEPDAYDGLGRLAAGTAAELRGSPE